MVVKAVREWLHVRRKNVAETGVEQRFWRSHVKLLILMTSRPIILTVQTGETTGHQTNHSQFHLSLIK